MLDFDALTNAILEGAMAGLGRGAKIVEARAKARAPVRNIFGNVYSFRPKSATEFASDLRHVSTKTIEEMAGGDIGHFGTRWRGPRDLTKQGLAQWRERSEEAAQEHLARYEAGDDTPLTRRGAHEVRTMRARFHSVREGGEVTVGGRLRGEIHSTRVVRTGGGQAEVMVISPTPYAKYMEFGTRHNRAHPFLRPALEESRGDVVAQVASAVAEASKKGLGGVQLEISVRL